jgi:cyclopropane fatty-acyl-phospholipid synthase-like methyltransferase
VEILNKINEEIITNEREMIEMINDYFDKKNKEFWDKFYLNRDKKIPFFEYQPDENLRMYFNDNLLQTGKALDVGCGNGRNTFFLAENGFDATGLDISKSSIEWTNEHKKNQSGTLRFVNQSLFDYKSDKEEFEFIYDSGCFHHINPHNRDKYLSIISNYMKKDGLFSMVCFNLKGGANISDYDVYKEYSMHGGLGFSEYKLRTLLENHFEILEFREMKEANIVDSFGKSFLWTVLMKKK